MKGVIEVVTQSEFDAWLAKQKPAYFGAFPEKDPANQKPATPATDTTKTSAKNNAKNLAVKKQNI
jgi:cytochrome c oxidase subunit 2